MQQSRKSRKSKKMQRRRGVVPKGAMANHQQDEGTARKIGKKPSDERVVDEDRKEKKKIGVFRKIGMMLNPEKEQGSTLKKKAAPKKKMPETRRKSSGGGGGVWNPDKTVHFNIGKAHTTIPLKGDPISDVQKRVFHKFAADAVKKSPPEFSTEFLSQVKPWFGAPMERKIFDSNPTKNRYKDVVCNDVTRVILNDGLEPNDYIHANYVNGLTVPFILTQGPTPTTITDFWRMMVHTKTSYIVMLCDVVEDGKPKCGVYFPDRPGTTMTFGVWSVTCVSDDDKDQNIHKRTFSVRCGKEEPPHVLKHLHTKSWPDKSVPNSTLSLLRMLYIVRMANGPVTVHCSAGIGRTGTFVAVEACLQVLTDGKELDLLAAVKQLRNSRSGSVQVDIQYMTLVQILINYGKDNGYWDDADLDDRVELLTWNIQQFIQSRGRNDVLMITPSTPNLSCVPAPPAAVTAAPMPPTVTVAQSPVPVLSPSPAPAHFTAAPAAPMAHAPVAPPHQSPAAPPPVAAAHGHHSDSQKGRRAQGSPLVDKEAQKRVPAPAPAPASAPAPAPVATAATPPPPTTTPTTGAATNGLLSKDSTEEGEEDEQLKIQSTQREDEPFLTIPPPPPPAPPAPAEPVGAPVEMVTPKKEPEVPSKEKRVREMRKNCSQYYM